MQRVITVIPRRVVFCRCSEEKFRCKNRILPFWPEARKEIAYLKKGSGTSVPMWLASYEGWLATQARSDNEVPQERSG